MSSSGRVARAAGAAALFLAARLSADDFDAVRQEFLAGINSRRVELSIAPLRLSRPLAAVAQELAEEAARRSNLDPTTIDQEEIVRRAGKAGYSAKGIAEVFTLANGNVDEVIRYLSESGGSSWRSLLNKTFLDFGAGVATFEDASLYVFVLGISWADHIADRAEQYRDLPAMRREMLERVNTERRRRALPPLRPTPVLDRIAQAYAEDMLKRSFYGHDSPEGETVRERAIAGGYRLAAVGENVASGQPTIDVVMDGWMASDKHRANVLSKVFTEAGFGLAIGKNRSGYQMIWVQVFGRPRVPIG